MASASSTSARNLFQESKQRLAERVQVNINSIGSLTRQIQRGSKSQEILGQVLHFTVSYPNLPCQTVKNFAHTEVTIANTEQNLAKLQVIVAQLQQQQQSVETSCEKISQVRSENK